MAPLKRDSMELPPTSSVSNSDGSDVEMSSGQSDDDFDDEVPDLSSFMTSVGQKRKIEQKGDLSRTKKLKSNKTTAPLTADELIYLKETENLFQSNVFRLQITELLNETKSKKSYKRNFNAWYEKFNKFIDGLEDSKEYEIGKHVKRLKMRGIVVPLPIPEHVAKISCKFVKPVKILTVGSFFNGTTLGSPLTVDIVLVMPKLIFKKSDKFDSQYITKRCLFLSHVAARLKDTDLITPGTTVEFTNKNGDALKPCLIFRPNERSAKALEIVLSAVAEAGTFKLTQFTPEKCNITSTIVQSDELVSSPHYNSTICEDLVLEENEVLKQSIFESNQNLKDAAVLLGVWLRQRNLFKGYGALNMHILCMYLVHMFKDRRINLSMSSNQIIRAFWLDLGRSNWTADGPSLLKQSSDASAPSKEVFHSHQEVVFIDASGFHNLAYKMTWVTYQKVKKEAEQAVNILNRSDSNSFQALFLKSAPFLHQYDNVICFQNANVVSRTVLNHAPKKLKIDLCHQSVPIFVRVLTQILEKGLGNRLDTIGISFPDDPRWQLEEPPPSCSLNGGVMIGFRFNPDTSLSVIDKGPPSNTAEGLEFREFWGDKSQLRRFKDGSVSESVIWADSSLPIEQRRRIVKDIIVFLLESKLGILENEFTYIGFQLSHLNRFSFAPRKKLDESFIALHKSFTRLSQELHSLELPLQIVSVHCISEAYRFTDPFPPLKAQFQIISDLCHKTKKCFKLKKGEESMLPPYAPTVDLVVQMSISGKWPDNANACKRLVAAFYLSIGSAFSQKHLKTQVTPDYVIVFKDGFIFRIFLAYSKQIGILKQQVNEMGLKLFRETEESIAVEKKFINLPKLTGSLYGLSQIHSAFGPTCVLAKRWVSCQLFHDTVFPSIVTELLVANLFMSSQPVEVTTHPLPMFLRFLKALSSTNWHLEPVIVNFNQSLNKDSIAEIEKFFNSNRRNLPPLFLATPFDTSGVLWTKKAPTIPVLVRMAKLASVSLMILESTLNTNESLQKIFEPPTSIFHLVIRVDLKVVTRRHQRIDFEDVLSTQTTKSSHAIPVHNFDPVASYVEQLEAHYSDHALFFYDKYGGSEIGVLLKPHYTTAAPFKVSSFEGRKLVGGNPPIMKPDFDCLVEGFKVMGAGIVEEIVLNLHIVT